MMRSPVWLALAAAAVVAAGCVEKEPKQKKIDPQYVEQNILAGVPKMSNEVNADLGGKVVYLGCDIEKQVVKPGETILIRHYWKVTEPPGSEWRVFSHVVGAGKNDWMNVDYTDMRAGHPPGKWKAGQIIRDDQRITLDKNWKSPYAQIVVGLYKKGVQGTGGRMGIVSGPHDDESRVLAAKLKVQYGGPASPVRRYLIRRTAGPITIDGKADEPAWEQANVTTDFVDTEGGTPLGQKTSARMLWDEQNLYVFVQAEDTDVFSEFVERDGTLWKADVIELFIDADRNRSGYVELQVNPNNAQFDAWFPTVRPKSEVDWSAEMKSAVNVRGTTANRHDKDQGWDVEIAIPLAAVKGRDEDMDVAIPPKLGDEWRLNIVRVDKPRDAKQIRASSLEKITIQDFHALERLLPVYFADADNNTGRGAPKPKIKAMEPPTAPGSLVSTPDEPAAEGEAQ